MDKTREEFENWVYKYYEGQVTLKTSENGDYKAEMHTYTINSPYTMESKYVSNTMNIQIHDLWEAYKSRDKEIHKYEQIAVENSDWFDTLKIDFNKQKEENKELREILSDTIEYMFFGEVGARKRGTCFSDIIDRARQFLNTNSFENRVDSDFRL